MRTLDLNWLHALVQLDDWRRQPFDVQAFVLAGPVSAKVELSTVSEPLLEELEVSRWTRVDRGAGVVVRSEDHAGVIRALRAMVRAPVLHAYAHPSAPRRGIRRVSIDDYLVEHGAREDLERLGGLDARGRQQVAMRLSTASWLSGFLERERPGALSAAREERYAAIDEEVLETARLMLLVLVEQGEPWSLFDAWDTFVEQPLGAEGLHHDARAQRFAAALHFVLSEVLVLIGVDDGLHPFLGIWPQIISGLRRRREVESLAVELEEPPAESWHGCLVADDLAVLLAECAGEAPRVKANGWSLYARSSRQVRQRLPAVPAWVAEVGILQEPDERIDRLVAVAQMLGFVEVRGRAGRDLRLVLADAGREWMRSSAKDRVKAIADRYRNDGDGPGEEVEEEDDLSDEALEQIRSVRALLPYRPYHYYLWNVDFRTPALDAFRSVELDEEGCSRWLSVAAFLRRHGARNPIHEHLDTEKIDWLGEDDVERMWVTVLASFLFDRLLQLGAVELGRVDDELAFRILPLAGFLLGLSDDFEWQSAEAEAQLIVQPNFEVVFLAPSLAAAQELAAFAEGLPTWEGGGQVGTLFQLSRASVHRALSSGWQIDRLLDRLAELSSQPVPANVQQQLRNWADQLHWAKARRITVLEFDDDPEGAALAVGALGSAGRLLSETVVEVDNERLTEAQRRKLRTAGVFLREEGRRAKKPRRR